MSLVVLSFTEEPDEAKEEYNAEPEANDKPDIFRPAADPHGEDKDGEHHHHECFAFESCNVEESCEYKEDEEADEVDAPCYIAHHATCLMSYLL